MNQIGRTYLYPLLAVYIFIFNVGCGGDSGGVRFISDTDTTYSQDVRDISKKVNNSPKEATLYATRANTFFYEDNFQEALADIEYAILLDSNNAAYHFKKAEYMLNLDSLDFKTARKSYEKALKLQPSFSEAGIALSKLLIARQEYAQAEVHLSDLLYQNKTNSEAYFYRGIAKKEQGDTVIAVDMFTQALVHNDEHKEANLQLAHLYAAKDKDIALQYFNKVLAIDEFSFEATYGKGLFLQKRGKYKDAIKLYEETVRLNPGHRLAYYNMSYIFLLFGEHQLATEKIETALKIAPDYDMAYFMKGLIMEDLGDKKQALTFYDKALEINPENTWAKKYKAKLN